jgi:hypothetical protein
LNQDKIENMPRRPATPPPAPADWPPEKTYGALRKQLEALDGFRNRNYRQVEHEEQGWMNLTVNILTHGFGEKSNNVGQFHHAKWAGEHNVFMEEGQIRQNFIKRIEALDAMLRSSLAELELMLPEPQLAGAYDVGEDYAFYRDVKTIVGFAKKELFIIDNYLDTQVFDLYVENIDPSVGIRVLTNNVGAQLQTVVGKFAKRGNFELRASKDAHDRAVFADDRCWVIGQSIKDAAVKKPTYIVEHSGSGTMRSIYEGLWTAAVSIVKS